MSTNLKIISFNANGIRSAARKGFFEWMQEQNPDVVCIQETKAQVEQLKPHPEFFPENYHCEYFDAVKKGYSGVALYARKMPSNIVRGSGFKICHEEGRYLQFDYPKVSIISLYLPSGTSGDVRQSIKFDYLEHFTQHLMALKSAGRELVICGDYNIAHKAIDLKNWRSNQKNSGFLPEERAWMDDLFGPLGFVDAFRVLNQQADEYTWWSNRGQARANNVGWRLDYQVITPGLANHLKRVEIYRDKPFSDHAPLIIEYEGDWFA